MAEYKVPQDVEADDKLIGPFSFRQFIYLIVVAVMAATAYGLGRIFTPLAIIPLPVIIFFGALALPLRKDQPMEMYMAAILSFYLKPRKRLWDPDGIDSLIEITAPKVIEYSRVKDLDQQEAERRLSYLAEIVDSQGWAVRGVGVQAPNIAVNNNIYMEAQQVKDIQDADNQTSQTLKFKLDQSNAQHHQEMFDVMNRRTSADNFIHRPQPQIQTQVQTQPEPVYQTPDIPIFNPYPNSIHQSVINPISNQQVQYQPNIKPLTPSQNASVNTVPADIIDLANNTDLSIEAIAREASRIKKKQDEVFISLR